MIIIKTAVCVTVKVVARYLCRIEYACIRGVAAHVTRYYELFYKKCI